MFLILYGTHIESITFANCTSCAVMCRLNVKR